MRELRLKLGNGPKVRMVLAFALAAGVLGGCEGLRGPAPPNTADPNMFPARYRTEVLEFMRTYLNVPTNVREAYIAEPVLKPIAGTPRYVSCVRYNAKGTDGRYMGSKDDAAIFLGGRLNQFLDATREQCGSAAYQRFPELEQMVP